MPQFNRIVLLSVVIFVARLCSADFGEYFTSLVYCLKQSNKTYNFRRRLSHNRRQGDHYFSGFLYGLDHLPFGSYLRSSYSQTENRVERRTLFSTVSDVIRYKIENFIFLKYPPNHALKSAETHPRSIALYYEAQAGKTHLADRSYQSIRLKSVLKHPRFNVTNFDNDISISFLIASFEYGLKIQPIALPPTADAPLPIGDQALITGWGATKVSFGFWPHRGMSLF